MDLITHIINKPVSVNNIPQNHFQSHSILLHIIEMLKRGDSRRTILETYEYIINLPQKSI